MSTLALETPAQLPPSEQAGNPDKERFLDEISGRIGSAACNLWASHYDSPKDGYLPRGIDDAKQPGYDSADEFFGNLGIVKDQVEQGESRFWTPADGQTMSSVVLVAEKFRRDISPDAFAMSNSIGSEFEIPKDGYMNGTYINQFSLNDKSQLSPRRKIHGPKDERYIPIESKRIYHEIIPEDLVALSNDDIRQVAAIMADALSPVRNDHSPLSEEVLETMLDLVDKRQEELGVYDQVLKTNIWRLAEINGYKQVIEKVKSSLGQDSALRYFMDTYVPQEVTVPDHRVMAENSEQYLKEFEEKGGDLESLRKAGEPTLRIRISSAALWSVANRDGGMLRSGDEGFQKGPNRFSPGSSYVPRRYAAEKFLFGPAGVDEIAGIPIVYAYCSSEQMEESPVEESLDRIYGETEIVLKPNVKADKRFIYGDSLNAIALAAQEPENAGLSTEQLVEKVLSKRVVPEEDAGKLAQVIAELHGQDVNSQFAPSANPYIECLLRGRINLTDCDYIIMPKYIIDSNPQLIRALKGYGVSVVEK